ncbi:hypothetical protein K438DRAFT_2027472 [Mycena galopus ATCC 62051]|nr:hypothetical protein K438DRAFT_2027472 [Mycena galopus ATCC 62051]
MAVRILVPGRWMHRHLSSVCAGNCSTSVAGCDEMETTDLLMLIETMNILSLASPCFHSDPTLGLVMQRITPLVAIPLLSTLVHLAAGISLLNPTTDVTLGTFVDCQWNAVPTDPATFSLVMQFSNGSADFGDHDVITIVQRGNATTGIQNDITNVNLLGPHRLAAYADPFDPTTEPLAVAPTFQVIVNPISAFPSNSAAPPLLTNAPAPMSNLPTGPTPTRFSPSFRVIPRRAHLYYAAH